jgi:fucose 4-O-acetylase-like acetyltransferase
MGIRDLYLASDYIDRSSSNIIKGILICLIVMGHNYVLSATLPGLFDYLYTFHLFIFFILPFFYLQPSVTYNKTLKRTKKLLIYYLVAFTLLVSFHHFNNDLTFSFSKTLLAFLKGGHKAVCSVTGFQYLWFLPAFIVAMLVYDLYQIASHRWKIAFCAVAVLVFLFFVRFPYRPHWALIQGIYFASVGLLSVILYNLVKDKINFRVILIVFIVLSALFFVPLIGKVVAPIMPFVAFVFLWELVKAHKDKLYCFESLGKNSLLIYLLHPTIYQILVRIIPVKPMLPVGLIVLVLATIMLSALLAEAINRAIKA